MKRRTLLVSTAAALASGGCTALFYHPDDRLYSHPDKFGHRYDTPHFASGDGTELTGLFLHARTAEAIGTVVHFHGNAGNLTGHYRYADWLTEHGFNVFTFDYRGYGNSKGHPSPEGVLRDGIAAVRYVRGRSDVQADRVVVFGQSLGGAVAMAAAAECRDEIRAVALESPFSSYRSVARAKLKQNLLARLLIRPFTFLLVSDAASPQKAAPRVSPVPLVVIHGTGDFVVPYAEGVKLFHAAQQPKELWTVPEGGHTEAFTKYSDEYRPKLVEFYRRALGE